MTTSWKGAVKLSSERGLNLRRRKNALSPEGAKFYHTNYEALVQHTQQLNGGQYPSDTILEMIDDRMLTWAETGSDPFAGDEHGRDPQRWQQDVEAAEVADEARRLRIRLDARKQVESDQISTVDHNRYTDGGSFIFDRPETVPAWWGRGQDILGADGEALMICGPPGVGKTTLTGQLVRAFLGLQPDVLGYPVRATGKRVLYLAMDRPQQIARSLGRHFKAADRDIVAERLVIWQGPPIADFAMNTDALTTMCQSAGADIVIVDSLKDAALGLVTDEGGAAYNRARQTALAAGIQVIELHHQVKRGDNGKAPRSLADVYGSMHLTSGAGSVILLHGQPGDAVVDLIHLKQPAEPIGPMKVIHDHTNGVTTVLEDADPIDMLRRTNNRGLTARDLADQMFGTTPPPTQSQTEKARRKLNSLEGRGQLASKEIPDPRGGKPGKVYYLPATTGREQPREQPRPLFGEDPPRGDEGNHEPA